MLLVAIWLPATLHCQLESAGFSGGSDCCAVDEVTVPSGDCADDACPALEQALYKESSSLLKVAAPAGGVCFAGGTCPLPAFLPQPALSPARHAPPRELRVAWQFISRAAPPARAPSLNA